MFPKKNKVQENTSIVLNPGIEQDEFSGQIYNQQQQQAQFQQQPMQNQPIQNVQQQQFQQPNQPMQQVQPVQVQEKPTKSVITKVELIDGVIHFEGQANYLINIGDCQIN
jgi:uncharacterized ferritin-like protein (DUF455 family)